MLNFCNISDYPFPRGMMSKFPGERGMKIRPIPRGIGDGDPRGINPTSFYQKFWEAIFCTDFDAIS